MFLLKKYLQKNKSKILVRRIIPLIIVTFLQKEQRNIVSNTSKNAYILLISDIR